MVIIDQMFGFGVPLDVNMYTSRLIVDMECLVLCLLRFRYGFGCFS